MSRVIRGSGAVCSAACGASRSRLDQAAEVGPLEEDSVALGALQRRAARRTISAPHSGQFKDSMGPTVLPRHRPTEHRADAHSVIARHDRSMTVNTPGVRSAKASRTSSPGPGSPISTPPRGLRPRCSRSRTAAAPTHPEIAGLENTCTRSGTPPTLGYRLPRDRRARHQRRGRCSRSTTPSWTGSPTPSGAIAGPDARRGRGRARSAGASGCPTLAAAASTRSPTARFNIDLKSDRGGAAARRLHRRARGLGPGAGRRRSRRRRLRRVPAAHRRPGARPRRTRSRWWRSGCCPAAGGRPASPGVGSRRSQVPHRRGRLAVVTAGLVRRAHARRQAGARLDDRRPRRDARAARSWCRRADDRPHRHTQGRARPSAGSGGKTHDRRRRPAAIADLRPLERAKEQRAWYWYDWANSAYVTTIATVLFAPYLTSVAETGACGKATDDDLDCNVRPARPRASASPPARWSSTLVTVATILSALVLPVVGAIADRSSRQEDADGAASPGPAARCAAADVLRRRRQLAARRGAARASPTSASAPAWSSTTRSCVEIAEPDERDRVSSRGWALGYLGGGILLAVNLARGDRARLVGPEHRAWRCGSACSAPASGGRPSRSSRSAGSGTARPSNVVPEPGGLVRQSFGQLCAHAAATCAATR